MYKICYRCDAKNDLYATVCQNCGYNLYNEIEDVDKIKKGKPKYFLIFGIVVPLIIITLYFIGMYVFLYGFENYNSEVYLNEYIDLIKNKEYEKIMKINNIQEDKFNTSKEFATYIDKEYGNDIDKIVVVKNTTSSNENDEYYKVQFDNKNIKEYKLSKTYEKKLLIFNTWAIQKPEQNIYTESVKIYCPIGVEIYLNGSLVTDEYLTNEEFIFTEFSGIKDEAYKHPKLICYEINNLISISSLQAKQRDDSLCEIITEKGYYKVTANIPKKEEEILKPLAEEVSKKYAAFIAEDCTFSEISTYIYKNTEFYDTLKEFYNGWFPEHSTFGYENIEFNNLLWYDENHSSMQVKFNFFITYGNNKTRDYSVAYEIYFVKIDGEWKVINIKNF